MSKSDLPGIVATLLRAGSGDLWRRSDLNSDGTPKPSYSASPATGTGPSAGATGSTPMPRAMASLRRLRRHR